MSYFDAPYRYGEIERQLSISKWGKYNS